MLIGCKWFGDKRECLISPLLAFRIGKSGVWETHHMGLVKGQEGVGSVKAFGTMRVLGIALGD